MEDRSRWSTSYVTEQRKYDHVDVVNQDVTSFEFKFRGKSQIVTLRMADQISCFLDTLGGSTILLDVTGLLHSTWAPLMKVAIQKELSLKVIYVEPAAYARTFDPFRGEVYELSEKFHGIKGIPGFINIRDRSRKQFLFIPALGFEGDRFKRMLRELEPDDDLVYPIIGVPGFRPEFPFYAFSANFRNVEDSVYGPQISYARANEPFSIFDKINKIANGHEEIEDIVLSPIGTKPHAVGMFLFGMLSTRRVEIIYDHPVRKGNRTKGFGKVAVYNISEFVENYNASD